MTQERTRPEQPKLLSTADEADALLEATTPEQIERIVSAWTKRADQEATALLAPVRALMAAGGSSVDALAAMHAILVEQSLEMQRVTMRDRLSTRLRFGKASEKLDADELKQAYLAFEGQLGPDGQVPNEPSVPAPGPAAAEADPELAEALAPTGGVQDPAAADAQDALSTQDTASAPNGATGPKKRRGGGRRALNEALQRIETLVRVPDADRACVLCGIERTCVGYCRHVSIEYKPPSIELHVEKREVLACSPCRKDMSTAPRAEPRRKVRAAPSLLAETLILKCDDALPLHRVREQFIRAGFDPPMSTLGRWWDYVTKLLGPLADVIVGRLLADDYLGVDDTGLLYLNPTDKGKKRPGAKGHLWCFVGQGPLVGFRFTETWEADQIAVHLRLAEGFVQGDGYAGYGSEVGADGGKRKLIPDARRLGCLIHARRPFHELVAAKDVRANPALLLFQAIYKLEAEYRQRGLDHAARGRERLTRSLPLFEKLAVWVHQIEGRLRPKDPLAKAITYFINQEPFLRRCFTDGRFDLDTSRVERAIREVAIGRKNFVLTGSPEGAKRLATAYTVIESARRALGTERLRPYLIDIIAKLESGWPLADLHALLPLEWAQSQARQETAADVLPAAHASGSP